MKADWLRPLGQVIMRFLVEEEPLPFPTPPPEPRYPDGFAFTMDGDLVFWTCRGCQYQFVFTLNYDPQMVLRNLTVHRLRCKAPLESVSRVESV